MKYGRDLQILSVVMPTRRAFSDEIFAVIYSRHRSLQSETKICVDIWILILRSRMFTPSIPSIYVDFTRCIVDL